MVGRSDKADTENPRQAAIISNLRTGKHFSRRLPHAVQQILLDLIADTKLIDLTINGNARSFEGTHTVAQLVSRMGLEGKRIAIERNGEIVPRAAFAETELVSGDRLEIVGAVGGG